MSPTDLLQLSLPPAATTVVGIADLRVTRDPKAVLATYALGSCMAVAVHDPLTRVSGLLHVLLPSASADPDRARTNPAAYADTGVPLLLLLMREAGADPSRLSVHLVGGAQLTQSRSGLRIGERNLAAVRGLFLAQGMPLRTEEVGGRASRSVVLEAESGRLWIRSSTRAAP